MNRNNSHRSASRSASRHRAGSTTRQQHPDAQINTFEIVRLINSTEAGRLELGTVRHFLFKDVDPRSNAKFEQFELIWQHLLENEDNFILSDQLKDVRTLSGNETVEVRTALTLCKTHIRRGKGGRNRTCDGECGALHVCRTFLLCSKNKCPFSNKKKKKCMFGHSFATDHNKELLKAHNLYGLDDADLRKLFRRRPSRSANTLPQLCIYYNRTDGKKCSRENCKSLHLCADFVQQRCDGSCSRNHKLSTSQVQRVLDLFAIDRSWSSEMLLEDLQCFMIARHRHETGSNSSGEDSDASESSEPGGRVAEGPARYNDTGHRHETGSNNSGEDSDTSESSEPGGHVAEGPARLASPVNVDTSAPFISVTDKSQIQCGCEELRKDIARMQLTISWLTSQVSNLTKIVESKTDRHKQY